MRCRGRQIAVRLVVPKHWDPAAVMYDELPGRPDHHPTVGEPSAELDTFSYPNHAIGLHGAMTATGWLASRNHEEESIA